MSDHPLFEAHPGFAFTGNPLERESEHRGDAAWLAAHRDSAAARFVIFAEGRVLTVKAGSAETEFLLERATADALGADAAEMVLLGFRNHDRAPIFAAPLARNVEDLEVAHPEFVAIDLRTLAREGRVAPGHLGLLAQASSLLHWHATHRFCARCGTRSEMTQGGYRRDCPSCEALHFPRTDPVAIMLVTDGEDCLMGRSPRLPEGVYSTLAGFIEPGETAEEAVRREVFEEAGIHVGEVTYMASQPWPFPASLMIGCHGRARSREIVMDATELDDCRWFTREEVRLMLADRHPDGVKVPPALSIAHWLIRTWAEEGA
jgi:NAD+ diphosphatase